MLYRQSYFAGFQVLALVIISLSLIWVFGYLGGLTPGATELLWLMNWHQVCMVAAFAVLFSNAVVVYRLVESDFICQHKTNAVLLVGAALLVVAGLIFIMTWKIMDDGAAAHETLISSHWFWSFHSWSGVITTASLITLVVLRLFYHSEHSQLVIVLTVFTLGAAMVSLFTGAANIIWFRNKMGFLSYSSRDPEAYVCNFMVLLLFIQVGAILWVWYRMRYSAVDREEYSDDGKDNTHTTRPMEGAHV